MPTPSRLTICLAGLILAACHSTPAPVPVVGEKTDLSRLVGTWSGEYSSTATGRSGTITFIMAAAADSAFGDVVMIPAGWNQPVGPRQTARAVDPKGQVAKTLTISFVRVSSGGISGRLAPYLDPACSCQAITRFEGRLMADTLAGTFITEHEATGRRQGGEWKVVRSAPIPPLPAGTPS
jgi:hypothetical protein